MGSNPRTSRQSRTSRVVVKEPDWILTNKGMSIIGSIKVYNTYQEFLNDKYKADLAYVKDATGDVTVEHGSAIYRIIGSTIEKIYEQETTTPTVPESIFIREEGSIMVLANHMYFVEARLEATMPINAKDGDKVLIAILNGGQASTIKPAEGQSIDGSGDEIALNAPGETFRFVFNKDLNKWIQF